jgi:hypothetical protein
MQGTRDDSVSIEARLLSGMVVRFPEHARYFYLLQKVQTGCEACPAFYSQSAGDKVAGREADHSLPSQASRD